MMTAEDRAPEHETVAMVEELATPECWRLLARSPVGRLCFVAGGEPAVLPINHVVDDHSIVIRTGRTGILESWSQPPPSRLAAAGDSFGP